MHNLSSSNYGALIKCLKKNLNTKSILNYHKDATISHPDHKRFNGFHIHNIFPADNAPPSNKLQHLSIALTSDRSLPPNVPAEHIQPHKLAHLPPEDSVMHPQSEFHSTVSIPVLWMDGKEMNIASSSHTALLIARC